MIGIESLIFFAGFFCGCIYTLFIVFLTEKIEETERKELRELAMHVKREQ